MDTITKSTKKSLLAATVVALLALVAIAGAVTYSADDSSAETTNYNYLTGSLDLQKGDSSANYFFAENLSDKSAILTIPADANFTGSVTVGYHVAVANTNYDVVYNSVSFANGISNATITMDANGITVTTLANDATVDLTLNSGYLTIGSAVSGTVTVGDSIAVFGLNGVSEITIGVNDGVAAVCGEISAGTLTLKSGTAYAVDELTIDAKAKIVVAEGATLSTMATSSVTSDFTLEFGANVVEVVFAGDEFTETVGATAGATGQDEGTSYMTLTAATGSIAFAAVPDGEYTLTATYAKIGTVTAGTEFAIKNVITYNLVVYNGQYYVFPSAAVTDATNGTATYSSTDSTYSFAVNTNVVDFNEKSGNVVGTNSTGSYTGAVNVFKATTSGSTTTFSAMTSGTCTADKGVLTFKASATDLFGTGTSATTSVTLYLVVEYGEQYYVYKIVATKGTDSATYTFAQADTVLSTSVNANAVTKSNETFEDISVIYNNGTLTVEGTVNITSETVTTAAAVGTTPAKTVTKFNRYTTGAEAVTDVANGTMVIALDAGTAAAGVTQALTKTCNAAYYTSTVKKTTTEDKTEYITTETLTDLTSALKNAPATDGNVTVTVIGTLTITDAALELKAANATKITTVIVGTPANHAILNIGQKAAKDVTAATSVVTVPKTSDTVKTTLTVDATVGIVNVVDGKLIVVGDKDASSTMYDTTQVTAAVFTTDGTNGTYTDLTTALAEAKAKDVVALRQNATVTKDTTVIADVTLDLKGFQIFVGDNDLKGTNTPTFTIDGTILSSATDNTKCVVIVFTGATVVINGAETTTPGYLGYLIVGGTITINKDLAIAGIQTAFGTVNVNANVTSDLSLFRSGNVSTVIASTATLPTTYAIALNVTGEATLKQSNAVALTDKMSLTVDVKGILNMQGTYTNAGAVTITVEKDAKLVPTAAISITNNGKLTLSVAGTLAYDKDKAVTITNAAGTVCDLKVAGTLGLKAITDAAKTASVTVTGAFTVADISSVNTMTVSAGSFAATKTFDVTNTLTVSGTATFKAAGTATAIAEATVSDSASLTESAAATITKLTVLGTATVKGVAPATTGTGANEAVISVGTLTVGTAPSTIGESVNGATVAVTLTGYGIVYGTAANVAILPENIAQTQFFSVGNNDNYLYSTQYDGANSAPLALAQPKVNGYNFVGWFNATAGGSVVPASTKVGEIASVYGIFEPKIFTVTFTHLDGAIYLVNENQVQSGGVQYAYGTVLNIKVIAASGYDASKATVSPATLTVTEDATVTAAGITEKTASKDNGLSLTDILLIILVIITAIVAIAVVLKLARS